MSQPANAERVARLQADLQQAPKARHVFPPFLAGLFMEEIRRRGGTDREIVKRVKRSLHQVGGAYLTPPPRYERLLARLTDASVGPERHEVARGIVTSHASMRERAAHLDDFHAALFDGIGHRDGGWTVLDLACGLNPLVRSLIPVDVGRYLACDVYLDMLDFVAEASSMLGHPVETFPWDLTAGLPDHRADIVLLLKTLPCLDQLDPAAGPRLLAAAATRCTHLLISYPVQSLGGADRGMRDHYASTFHSLVDRSRPTMEAEVTVTDLDLPAELGYRLTFSS